MPVVSRDQFRVSVDPDRAAEFLHLPHVASERWSLAGISLGSGYAAAVAYRDTAREVELLRIIDPSELLGLR